MSRRSRWAKLGYASAFGAAAAVIVAGGVVARLPGALVVTDPREIVVSLGAALCGPLGGALIGFLAGIFERIPGVALPSALGHAAAGAWMGWAYGRIALSERCRRRWSWFALAWTGALAVYYAGVLYPVGLLASAAVPAIWADPRHQGYNPVTAIPAVLSDASVEFLFTLVFTIVALWAMPRSRRWPCDVAAPEPGEFAAPRPTSPGVASAVPAWCWRWLSALAAGLAAATVLAADLHMTIPGTQLPLDLREAFVTIGAALVGPWPALLVGVLAGAVAPTAHGALLSMVSHAVAAVAMAGMYRWLTARAVVRDSLPIYLLGWCGLVWVYYLGLLVPLTWLQARAWPALAEAAFGGAQLTPDLFWSLVGGAARECLATCCLTTVALWALPKRHRLAAGYRVT